MDGYGSKVLQSLFIQPMDRIIRRFDIGRASGWTGLTLTPKVIGIRRRKSSDNDRGQDIGIEALTGIVLSPLRFLRRQIFKSENLLSCLTLKIQIILTWHTWCLSDA